MKIATKFRNLTQTEAQEATKVFGRSIPYSQVMVSDGLGDNDRPYTIPRGLAEIAGFLGPIPGLIARRILEVPSGKYVMHVGPGYYGLDASPARRSLLIHELVHVWQGEHSTHPFHFVFSSMWHQHLNGRAAYYYDETNLKNWDEYNPEQQANIVEHWYSRAMIEDEALDGLYRYIPHIRGDRRSFQPVPLHGPSLLPADFAAPSFDHLILPLLEQRFAENDVAGFGARVRKLQELFASLGPTNVAKLLQRLEARRPGDKVAQLFHGRLSRASTGRLMGILKKRSSRT